MIREYEAVGYFPASDGRAPLDEQVPTPAPGEVVVFRDFFTCGLRFPCYCDNLTRDNSVLSPKPLHLVIKW
jgi:hypothetical protein